MRSLIEIKLNTMPEHCRYQMALRLAKASADDADIDWADAHILVRIKGGKTLLKLPGHIAMREE